MVSDQQRLFDNLCNNGWDIRKGKISKNIEYGQCEGFYFYPQMIQNNDELKTIAEKILQKYQSCYRPIVIMSAQDSNWNLLFNTTDEIEDDGRGLRLSNGIYFVLNRWREKGVDVNMAIDMIDLTYSHKMANNNLDAIVVISSDSDLKPAIKMVQLHGISVEYVGFEHMYSIALLNTANKRLLLTEKQLEEFFPSTLVL